MEGPRAFPTFSAAPPRLNRRPPDQTYQKPAYIRRVAGFTINQIAAIRRSLHGSRFVYIVGKEEQLLGPCLGSMSDGKGQMTHYAVSNRDLLHKLETYRVKRKQADRVFSLILIILGQSSAKVANFPRFHFIGRFLSRR